MHQDSYKFIGKIYDWLVEPSLRDWRQIALALSPLEIGMRVLDVGCGTGTLLRLYQAAGFEVSGIDASPTMLGLARVKLGETADLRLGDAARMPFQGEAFDLVTAVYSLHEMPSVTRSAVMQEIIRLVKPAGRILIIEYQAGPYPFPSGWTSSISRNIVERLAGQEHYKNFCQFIAQNDLLPLIDENHLSICKKWVPEVGTSAIYLLSR
ncbi:MAG: class I SAM-dependent methyltransferase [Chloroflexi bacterium]|nr:class I SAM-dependent methyltransferase [Chloroflexota bacterium]